VRRWRELVIGDKKGKMERYCWTGQSPQWDVAPTKEEECEAELHPNITGEDSTVE
jgi:hypothetical protein